MYAKTNEQLTKKKKKKEKKVAIVDIGRQISRKKKFNMQSKKCLNHRRN